MPKYPTFFRADDEIEPTEKGTPSPNEWFGLEKTKFRSSPTFPRTRRGITTAGGNSNRVIHEIL